jgi:DNA-binding NarL/FixJ family response regulator
MRAGARGYLLKGASPDEVMRAIAAVGSGEAIFSPSIATRLIDFFASLQPTALPQALPELTEREHEILTLLAQGQNNAAIAKLPFLLHLYPSLLEEMCCSDGVRTESLVLSHELFLDFLA